MGVGRGKPCGVLGKEEGGQISYLGDVSHLRGVSGKRRKIKPAERVSYLTFVGDIAVE